MEGVVIIHDLFQRQFGYRAENQYAENIELLDLFFVSVRSPNVGDADNCLQLQPFIYKYKAVDLILYIDVIVYVALSMYLFNSMRPSDAYMRQ